MLVLIEKNYKISVWCREIVSGLRQEARKRRLGLIMTTDISSLGGYEGNTVMIVGAETEWLNHAIKYAKKLGKHPIILSNQSASISETGVSRVAEDILGSMNEIIGLFHAKGVDVIALYAVNPASASDSYKKEAFLKSDGSSENVFINDASLSECFEEFYKSHKEKRFKGIICANDFAAISLVMHLKKSGEDISNIDIISYSDTIISNYTSPSISTVSANFKSFGQLAFMIFDSIGKGNQINGMHVFCKWDIKHRETSSAVDNSKCIDIPLCTNNPKSFYEDPELIEMMRVETLLSECDNIDREIVSKVLAGKKTSEIAELCFLTESALKYRINKMKKICFVDTRSELRNFLCRYISKELIK